MPEVGSGVFSASLIGVRALHAGWEWDLLVGMRALHADGSKNGKILR